MYEMETTRCHDDISSEDELQRGGRPLISRGWQLGDWQTA
jgi:hypothetical protein